MLDPPLFSIGNVCCDFVGKVTTRSMALVESAALIRLRPGGATLFGQLCGVRQCYGALPLWV